MNSSKINQPRTIKHDERRQKYRRIASVPTKQNNRKVFNSNKYSKKLNQDLIPSNNLINLRDQLK